MDTKYNIAPLGSRAFSPCLQTKPGVKGGFNPTYGASLRCSPKREGGRKAAAWACITENPGHVYYGQLEHDDLRC